MVKQRAELGLAGVFLLLGRSANGRVEWKDALGGL